MKVLFIGGTGQISLPCVERSVAAGHDVSVLNRGVTDVSLPESVKQIVGDTSDGSLYNALPDGNFDVVCQFRAFDPKEVARDIEMFSGKVGQYIFISSASAYLKPATDYLITEETPLINPFWLYSRQKAECEDLLRHTENLPWTIVRPSHTMRVGLPTFLNDSDTVGLRILNGKPVLVAGDGLTLWTLTRPADFAVPFVNLFGNARAIGEDFHITGDKGFTWDDIYTRIGEGLGVEADIVHVPTDTLIKYNPEWEGPLYGDKVWCALFDNSKVKSVAGDFSCSEDLDEILAEPILNFKSRVKAGLHFEEDADSRLRDRIAAEQRALGG